MRIQQFGDEYWLVMFDSCTDDDDDDAVALLLRSKITIDISFIVEY